MSETPIAVRVTALEMTAPPKQTLPRPVNIQTAVLRVPEITPAYYRFLYMQVGRRWHWTERLRLDDDALAALLLDKRNDVTVLYVNGAPAGFFELRQEDDGVVELSHFGLMAHALGHGLGKWFLLQALLAGWSLSPSKMTVTTNTLDHPRALQLYQRFGFSPVSTRDAEIVPLTDQEWFELARRL
ncbi:GNAT family N-acetyltransferase [Ensifer soli]|uniref:GNAT family N-acetyltransferase n=1 Tax=Ciceribacter sp. sgz301302 TaxID=3342379 RepID=UPI0035B75FFA